MQDGLVKSRKHFDTVAVIEQFDEIMGFVESTLVQWGVERIWVDKACLIVDEAITNIIRYAYPNGPKGRVMVSLLHTDYAVQLDIKDTGVPFNPTLYPDPDTTLPLEDRPVGGLGIHFIRKMLDVFIYRREGSYNHLTMKINTGKPESAIDQVSLIDDETASIGTLVAVKDDKLRALITKELSRQRFTIREISTQEQLDALVKRQCGIQLALLDRELMGDGLYDYAHRLKTRQQVPYVYAILMTTPEDSAQLQSDQRVDDIMTLPFDPVVFRRHLDVAVKTLDYEYRLLGQRLSHGQAVENLEVWQNHMVAELAQAAEYVQSLLPPPQEEPVRILWRFTPRSFLGGDLFGYQWLDEDHMAVYQMDTCGHGFRAAMFTVAVQNMLISRILPNVDRTQPSSVLEQLNRLFPMDQFNNMYFSFWVGVYNRRTRQLYYSSGGHPPPILIGPPDLPAEERVTLLNASGMALGCVEQIVAQTFCAEMKPGCRLYLYTDGLIENTRVSGGRFTPSSLAALLADALPPEEEEQRLNRIIQELYRGDMEDDCCLLSLHF